MGLMSTCYAFVSAYIPFVLDYGTADPSALQGLNFDPFLDCASTLIDTLIAIDGTWSREGVVVAATYDASANDDVQGYAGLAFEFVDSDNVNDESTAPQPMDGIDGGEYMLKPRFTSSSMVIIALSILCAVLIVILCARCWNGKRNAY